MELKGWIILGEFQLFTEAAFLRTIQGDQSNLKRQLVCNISTTRSQGLSDFKHHAAILLCGKHSGIFKKHETSQS